MAITILATNCKYHSFNHKQQALIFFPTMTGAFYPSKLFTILRCFISKWMRKCKQKNADSSNHYERTLKKLIKMHSSIYLYFLLDMSNAGLTTKYHCLNSHRTQLKG